MFCMSNELRNGDKRAWDALVYCFKNGVTISGRILNWLINEAETEYVIEEGYDDFDIMCGAFCYNNCAGSGDDCFDF